MNEPDAACREIERLFDQLRLCAVQIFTNVNGLAAFGVSLVCASVLVSRLGRYNFPCSAHQVAHSVRVTYSNDVEAPD